MPSFSEGLLVAYQPSLPVIFAEFVDTLESSRGFPFERKALEGPVGAQLGYTLEHNLFVLPTVTADSSAGVMVSG